MKKLFGLRIFYVCITLGAIQSACLQASQAPRAASRLSRINMQSLKRLWYGPEEVLASRTPKAEPLPTPKPAESPVAPQAQTPKTSFFGDSEMVKKSIAYAEQAKKSLIENPLNKAKELAKTASGTFNMAIFDENMISDEFSSAIVRIWNIEKKELISRDLKKTANVRGSVKAGLQGSAFIIQSEQNADNYYVLTAAHCVNHTALQFVVVSARNNPNKKIPLEVYPIIVDEANDVAILALSVQSVKDFQEETGAVLPAIPANQLSSVHPHKNEAVAFQGYPGFIKQDVPGFFRKKMATDWAEIFDTVGPEYPYESKLFGYSFTTFGRPQSYGGASGSPVFAERDKQLQILGVLASQRPNTKSPVQKLHSTGIGQLPTYLKMAERIRPIKEAQIQAAEKERKEESEKN